jgi:hypothetical protein
MERMRSFLTLTRLFAVVLALFMAAVPAIDSLESRVGLEHDGEEAADETLDQKASSPAPVSRASRRRPVSRVSLSRAVCAASHRPVAPPLSSAPDPVPLFRPLRC